MLRLKLNRRLFILNKHALPKSEVWIPKGSSVSGQNIKNHPKCMKLHSANKFTFSGPIKDAKMNLPV